MRDYWILMPYKISSNVKYPLRVKLCFLDTYPRNGQIKDKHLINILLVTCKKSITKKWLSWESPTLNQWMDITMDIYKMQRITAFC